MEALAELIEIYGRQPANAVPNDADYRRLCQDNDRDPVFHRDRERVSKLKGDIETRVGDQQTRQKQVQFAVRFIRQLAGDKDKKDDICQRLIVRAYYPVWTNKQKARFDAIIEHLRTSQDYFLSFTQRNRDGGGNPINSYHRHLIESYGIQNPHESPKNELADMLNRVLSGSRYKFRGFFFPAHENDSRAVAQKLQEAMDRSLVFIQLVQNDMFDRRYPAENYCFQEYTLAIAQQKEMVYVFADGAHPGDLIDDVAVRYELTDWYQTIRGVDCLDLETTIAADDSILVRNRERLRKSFVEIVQRKRELFWENIPGDLE